MHWLYKTSINDKYNLADGFHVLELGYDLTLSRVKALVIFVRFYMI